MVTAAADTTVFAILAEDLVAAGGEITPAIKTELDGLLLDVSMSDALIDMIQAADADEAKQKLLAAPFVSAALAAGNRAKNLRAYLKARMEAGELDSLKGPRHSCRIQNGVPSITFDGDPEKIPTEYRRTKYELDPNAVKLALSRKELPSIFTVTPKKTLVIVG